MVDDEQLERSGIEKLIHKLQYDLDVVQASGGAEAISLFRKQTIDILLTDIKMPLMSGLELIEKIQNMGFHPICILYSAYGEFEYAQNAISLGVLQYLLKPIRLDDFQQLMNKVIRLCDEKAKQQKDNEELRREARTISEQRSGKKILYSLEYDSGEDDTEHIFESGPLVPAFLSSYSYLFSVYWENYERDLSILIGEGLLNLSRNDSQMFLLIPQRVWSSREKIAQCCEKIIEISKQKYQSDVLIAVGKPCSNIPQMRKEYKKLLDQMDYQFFISESNYFINGIVAYQKGRGDMLSLYFKRIITTAEIRDFHGMKSEFTKAFDYIENNLGFSSIYIKYNVSEVIQRCCEILNCKNKIMEIVEDIYSARTLDQLRRSVEELIESLQKIGPHEGGEGRLVERTKEYVKAHYSDCTLGVSSIAEELEITPAYLSSLYKSRTGNNLVKYISQYRMEKAKELLVSTNMKVNDISSEVGYANSSYFISLFRTYTGISPARYRIQISEKAR